MGVSILDGFVLYFKFSRLAGIGCRSTLEGLPACTEDTFPLMGADDDDDDIPFLSIILLRRF